MSTLPSSSGSRDSCQTAQGGRASRSPGWPSVQATRALAGQRSTFPFPHEQPGSREASGSRGLMLPLPWPTAFLEFYLGFFTTG